VSERSSFRGFFDKRRIGGVQQDDHGAGGLPHDPIDQIQRMLGAVSESDESDIGPFASRHRSDVLNVDLTGDDLVAERGDDRRDEREAVLALVGDQDAQMLGSIGERRHTSILMR
jgi:hypothetical protein